MKVPVEWLVDLVGTPLKADLLAERLTQSGLEVEDILDSAAGPVLEIAITPNRGDCLSLYGLALETAAIFGLKGPKKISHTVRQQKGAAGVTIRTPNACTRYVGQVMEDVTVGPAPAWMQRRLEASGVRSINNVVDATNYVMLELGQPMHAFDLDRLAGEQIIVRNARANEKLITLDGKERSLAATDLVIADKLQPVALAGVMGGQESEVHAQTTRLFLESACFDAAVVRRTSKRLGLQSESSYRFERGVDWYRIGTAMERLVALLTEASGGHAAGRMTDVVASKPKPVRISLAPDRVSSILGGQWKRSDISGPLKRIGAQLTARAQGAWTVLVPSHRNDLQEEIDLIEEIARLRGYETIAAEAPARAMRTPVQSASRIAQHEVKRHLRALGFSETIHYSFGSEQDLARLGGDWAAHGVRLNNPLSQDGSHLRPTLLLSLLGSAAYHHHRQMTDLRLFELRTVFAERSTALVERLKLAGCFSGTAQPVHWSQKPEPVDFFEEKGVIEALLARMGLADVCWEPLPADSPYRSLLHPTRSAVIRCNGQELGVAGMLHPEREAAFELKVPSSVFELDWPSLLRLAAPTPQFRPYSAFPSVERDLAVVVAEDIPAARIASLIRKQGKDLVQEVRIFDVYRGDQVPEGKKSLAFAYRLGRRDRTLTDEEVSGLQEKIIARLKKELQAGIR